MDSCHIGIKAVETMESGVATALKPDQSSAHTTHLWPPDVSEKTDSPVNHTPEGGDEGLPVSMVLPVGGRKRGAIDESNDIGVQLIFALLQLDICVGASISSIPKDPMACAALTEWISQAINPDGTSPAGDSVNTIGFLDTLGDTFGPPYDAGVNLPALDMAILSRHQAIVFSGDNDAHMAGRLLSLGQMHLMRFAAVDSAADMDDSILCLTKASGMTQGNCPFQVQVSQALSRAHATRFGRFGRLDDINVAIVYQDRVLLLAGNEHQDYAPFLGDFGNLHLHRYKAVGSMNDINTAIICLTKTLNLSTEGHQYRTIALNNLGTAYLCRFERLGEIEDINQAIKCHIQAVQLTPEGHSDMPGYFSNLGNSYSCRFERLGELEDINRAIECQNQATQLTPEGHSDRPGCFSNLGTSYLCRFERLGGIEDINHATKFQNQAIQLIPEGHPDMPRYLSNLGNSYLCWFRRLGEIVYINKAIECQSRVLQLTPGGHAGIPSGFNNLGNSYRCRFERLGEMADINRAIECHRQAIQFTPEGHAHVHSRFNNLGISYFCRFERLGEMEDINRAIECHSQTIQLAPKGHAENPSSLNNLGNSYLRRFERLGKIEDINRAIECQNLAIQLIPEGHADMPSHLSNLGTSYLCRFERLGEMEDVNRAIECGGQAIRLTPEGHVKMPSRFGHLGNSYLCRFQRLGEMEDVNRAIECQKQAIQLTPEGDADMPSRFNNLGTSYSFRFERLGVMEDLNQSIECRTHAVQLTPEGHTAMRQRLNNLGTAYAHRFDRLKEVQDINGAIECGTQAILLVPDTHANKPIWLKNLGNMLQSRFRHLNESRDMEAAIEVLTQALHLIPQDNIQSASIQFFLGLSYLQRVTYSSQPEDLTTALRYFEAASHSPTSSPGIKFQASRTWAKLTPEFDSSKSLPAHHTTMQLLPEVIWLGTTFGRRYERVREVGAVAVEAAAAAVSAKEYGLALEWLEEGRSIVWNQILQLRTPVEDLAAVNPALAQSLQHVSRNLEQVGPRIADTTPFGIDSMAQDQVTIWHHRLVDQYNTLIDQARSLPGFGSFMRPRKTTELVSAAHRGPVVVVNIYTDRCDALILRPTFSDVAHLPLPDLSQAEVAHLHRLMLKTLREKEIRERGMSRLKGHPTDHLEEILTALWNKLVNPILDFLGFKDKLPVDQLPHITWCTTGELSFLPIHAAGIYHPGGDHIFDFTVSSYTPTINALLPSRSETFIEASGVLAVSQESTPGLSKLPGTKEELAHIKKHLEGLPYMQLENSQATPTDVLDAIDRYECVHLACHASQDTDDPRKSCFHLHNGTLSLEQIAQKSLKNKSLAFLSACQTAAGDQKLPDEAIHLAAGMLVAGYPSVIATMWSIKDKSAPLVADRVYGQLVRGGKLDCTQAARALHTAVGALRNKVGEKKFLEWAPFIHMGI